MYHKRNKAAAGYIHDDGDVLNTVISMLLSYDVCVCVYVAFLDDLCFAFIWKEMGCRLSTTTKWWWWYIYTKNGGSFFHTRKGTTN